jgi:hypothetical protein
VITLAPGAKLIAVSVPIREGARVPGRRDQRLVS